MLQIEDLLEFLNGFHDHGETRPWGTFLNLDVDRVKILAVKPGEQISYQYHHYRQEMWVVIGGHPSIQINERTLVYDPGDFILIKKGDRHQIIATQEEVFILELSFGDFSEDDIVRLEDKYNRGNPTIETE